MGQTVVFRNICSIAIFGLGGQDTLRNAPRFLAAER